MPEDTLGRKEKELHVPDLLHTVADRCAQPRPSCPLMSTNSQADYSGAG